MSLNTQFGRYIVACILALLAFPILYSGTIGTSHQMMVLGLTVFGIAMLLPLIGMFIKSKP